MKSKPEVVDYMEKVRQKPNDEAYVKNVKEVLSHVAFN